jgi:hypothetical protein
MNCKGKERKQLLTDQDQKEPTEPEFLKAQRAPKVKTAKKINSISDMLKIHEKNRVRYQITTFVIFSVAFIGLCLVYISAPKMNPKDKSRLMHIPQNAVDLV